MQGSIVVVSIRSISAPAKSETGTALTACDSSVIVDCLRRIHPSAAGVAYAQIVEASIVEIGMVNTRTVSTNRCDQDRLPLIIDGDVTQANRRRHISKIGD